MEQEKEKKSRGAKVLAAGSALVVVAVGAFFSGIGESLVNRVVDALSADTPPSVAPSMAKDAFTIALKDDIGHSGDLLALSAVQSDGPVAAKLKSGKLGESWEDFLAHNDGAPIDDMIVSIVLTGHRATGIRITDVNVVKVKTDSILAGTFVSTASASEIETIKLAANLDEAKPIVMNDGKPYFADRNINLKDGEQESIRFTLTAAKMSYRFVLGIDYVDETGAARQVFLDRLGRTYPEAAAVPADGLFSLTGSAPKYGAEWKGVSAS